MPRTIIADLAHFLDQGTFLPDLHPRGLRLARHLAAIVAWVTHSLAVGPQLTNVACRCRPGWRPCPGDIVADHDRITDLIHWGCPSCGDGGTIGGWRGTRWDCGMTVPAAVQTTGEKVPTAPSPQQSAATMTVTFTEEEKQLLEKAVIDYSVVTRLVPLPDGRQWSGSFALAEFNDLVEDVSLAADNSEKSKLFRRMSQLAKRLEMLQLAAEDSSGHDRLN
jgi:hypothetical protein